MNQFPIFIDNVFITSNILNNQLSSILQNIQCPTHLKDRIIYNLNNQGSLPICQDCLEEFSINERTNEKIEYFASIFKITEICQNIKQIKENPEDLKNLYTIQNFINSFEQSVFLLIKKITKKFFDEIFNFNPEILKPESKTSFVPQETLRAIFSNKKEKTRSPEKITETLFKINKIQNCLLNNKDEFKKKMVSFLSDFFSDKTK